ncbi:MAG: FAD:protein FMN transferase [Planctomycetaceae bacterium]
MFLMTSCMHAAGLVREAMLWLGIWLAFVLVSEGSLRAEVVASAEASSLVKVTLVEVHMGVPVQITLYAATEEEGERVARLAFRRIAELDAMLSDYQPESELSRLNGTAGSAEGVPVSVELFDVATRAADVSRRSDGAFDVTVGPVVQLWRKARQSKELPTEAVRKEAISHVGWKKIQLDSCRWTIQLREQGMRLDLGGIAKGYITDEALKVLKGQGVDRALVNAGGDMVLGEAPPGRKGWTIAVEPLLKKGADPVTYLQLSRVAVATSGDAYQFVEFEGKRYSHLVDPQTGLGLTDRSSVTVIAGDGATADAYASALSVLGTEKGMRLIETIDGAAALIMTVEEGAEKRVESKRFGEYRLPQE